MNEDDDDCFNYHSWKNNVIIVLGTLSSLRLSHVWMSYVTHEWRDYHTYASVMSHIWMRSVSHICKSHVVRRLPMIIWMKRCIIHMNESCHTYEWRGVSKCKSHTISRLPVALILETNHIRLTHAHISMSHFTHINESCGAYEWVMQQVVFQWRLFWKSIQWVIWHTRTRHVTHMNELCHISSRNHYLAWVVSVRRLGGYNPNTLLSLIQA